MSRGRVTGGSVVLLTVAVITASASGAVLLSMSGGGQSLTRDTFKLEADSSGTIRLTYLGGPPLNVDRLDISVRLDGQPLTKQPPIPFFAAHGFRGGPTGPFNAGYAGRWRPGEIGGFELASTNSPTLQTSMTVTVTLYRGSSRLWQGTTRVQSTDTPH